MVSLSIPNPLNKLSFKTRGYVALTSSFFQHLILGSYYVWGGILTYVTSSLRHDGQSYTKQDVAMLSPFVTLSLNIGTPFGPILANKIGFRPFMFINSILMGLSVIASSYFVNNFPLFVVLYGIIFGLLSGALYMVPFNTCYLYFPNRKGLVGGVITAGYALGSTALIWVMFALINPDNEKPSVKIDGEAYFSAEICDRLPFALRILGIIQIFSFIISTLFHQRPSNEEIQSIINQSSPSTNPQLQYKQSVATQNRLPTQNQLNKQESEATNLNQLQSEVNPTSNIISTDLVQEQQLSVPESYYEYDTIKECLKTKFIYMSIFMATIFTVYGSIIIQNYKILGEKSSSYSDSFLNAAGTTGCVVNCISRIIWGNLFEKYTLRRIATINLSFQIVLSVTFYWCLKEQPLFFIQIIMAFFALGGWLSMLPAQIVRVYGRKIGTTIYSVTFIGFSISSFTAFYILKYASKSIGLKYMFYIFTGIQSLALILVQFIDFKVKYRKKKLNQEILNKFQQKYKEAKL
ncbi:hypothetical protein ABPG72_018298 [Tetrahymena utriculariae]